MNTIKNNKCILMKPPSSDNANNNDPRFEFIKYQKKININE